MKNNPTPEEKPKSNVKKLYYFAAIMVLIAISAALLIIFLPDKADSDLNDKVRLAFEKQGTAVITGKDGIVKASFDLELAETLEAQKTGLMYRESMADKQGMLFVYETADKMNFWMRNTYLPLDIIFFLPDSTIYKVYPDNKPFDESGIAPAESCLYALEINAGLAKALNLIPGDKLTWQRTKQQ